MNKTTQHSKLKKIESSRIEQKSYSFGSNELTNYWNRSAIVKTVARVTRCATAGWRGINNSAVGIRSASSRTRINTFLIDTRQVWRAIGTKQTLGPTIRSRADHVGLASALSLSRHDLALRVWSTRRWIARVRMNRSQRSFFHNRGWYRCYKTWMD